jgi:protein-tyrosine phosphatase
VNKERKLALEGTFNTRDLGGYVNSDGKSVKWGKLFRSDALNKLSASDVEVLKSKNLKTVIDFRAKEEWTKFPDILPQDVKVYHFNPNAQAAALASGNIVDDKVKIDKLLQLVETPNGILSLQARLDEMSEQMRELVSSEIANQQYRKFIDVLASEDAAPILWHCKGGKDRAGFATIITLLILDVPKETIKQDYLLTKEYMAKRNEKRMDEYRRYTDHPIVLNYLAGLMSTKEEYFEATWSEMYTYGSPEQYLSERLGLTSEKKAKIKELYLEKAES